MKSKLVIEPYWNGYRPFYVMENGNKVLLHTAVPTKEMALAYGKAEVKGGKADVITRI